MARLAAIWSRSNGSAARAVLLHCCEVRLATGCGAIRFVADYARPDSAKALFCPTAGVIGEQDGSREGQSPIKLHQPFNSYQLPMPKEAQARIKINKLLEAAGWRFFDSAEGKANIALEPNVKLSHGQVDAMDELGNDFETTSKGFVDFLLLDEKALG